MDYFGLFGLLFNMLGVIYLAFGFQIEKTDAPGFAINGKYAVVLRYENSYLRLIGWFCLVFGFVLQIIALFS